MAKETNILWCDATWNPWQGCKKISDGCVNCYMYRGKERFGQNPSEVVRSKTTFNNPVKWKDSKRIFVCSWSDFFIKEADQWRDEAWEIIKKTPQHTYLILTKRPENIRGRLPDSWPYRNVWLGVTVESQKYINRLNILLDTPAKKRFVSIEPMIGPVDLGNHLCKTWNTGGLTLGKYLDWVIVGGESGPNARCMEPDWVLDILLDCRTSKTPFLMKQMSGNAPIPDFLNVRDFPKIEA